MLVDNTFIHQRTDLKKQLKYILNQISFFHIHCPEMPTLIGERERELKTWGQCQATILPEMKHPVYAPGSSYHKIHVCERDLAGWRGMLVFGGMAFYFIIVFTPGECRG